MSLPTLVPSAPVDSSPFGEVNYVASPASYDRWLAENRLSEGLKEKGVSLREGGPLLVDSLISLGQQYLDCLGVDILPYRQRQQYLQAGLICFGYRMDGSFFTPSIIKNNDISGKYCFLWNIGQKISLYSGDIIIAIGFKEEKLVIVPSPDLPF